MKIINTLYVNKNIDLIALTNLKKKKQKTAAATNPITT